MQSKHYKAIPPTSTWHRLNAFPTVGNYQPVNISFFQQTTAFKKKLTDFPSKSRYIESKSFARAPAVSIWAVKCTCLFFKSSCTSNDLFTARNRDFQQASCRQLHFPRIQNLFFKQRQQPFSFIQHRSVSTFSWHGGLRFSSEHIRELNLNV